MQTLPQSFAIWVIGLVDILFSLSCIKVEVQFLANILTTFY